MTDNLLFNFYSIIFKNKTGMPNGHVSLVIEYEVKCNSVYAFKYNGFIIRFVLLAL